MRRFALRAMAACISLAPPFAIAASDPSPGFIGVEEDEFPELFNKWAADLSMESRLKQRYCTDESQRTCLYTYRSIIFALTEASDGKGLKSVTAICARDCILPDVLSSVAVSLRILAPREPPRSFGDWVKGATAAAEAEKPFEAEIGPVRLSVPWLDGKAVTVYLTVKGDGAYDKPLK